MLPLRLGTDRRHLRVLCLGAHSDDIEIGCGGTILRWMQEFDRVDVTWCVLSAAGDRMAEARRSAQALLRKAAARDIVLGDFEDAAFPADLRRVKAFLQAVRTRGEVDVVLTHTLGDRHQDHRLIAELTWQVWRDHLVLEYEVPKYEGDLGQPNFYVALPSSLARRKVEHLLRFFGSQRAKGWFSAETFYGLMRIRGIETRSEWAEGFHLRKAVF